MTIPSINKRLLRTCWESFTVSQLTLHTRCNDHNLSLPCPQNQLTAHHHKIICMSTVASFEDYYQQTNTTNDGRIPLSSSMPSSVVWRRDRQRQCLRQKFCSTTNCRHDRRYCWASSSHSSSAHCQSSTHEDAIDDREYIFGFHTSASPPI